MIRIEQLSTQAGAFRMNGVSFAVAPGEYAVLMGRTGCGKTVLLETICGLKPAQSGRIRLQGREVTHDKPGERDIGYVPQDRALFPTMTVRENIAFALRIRRWPHRNVRERVAELAALLHIEYLLDRAPAGLSGGEAQRVALGRALAFNPPVLCLDEPLGALDYDTRMEMCALLKGIQEHTGVTTLHVTHDREEAHRLGDRVLFLDQGRITETP